MYQVLEAVAVALPLLLQLLFSFSEALVNRLILSCSVLSLVAITTRVRVSIVSFTISIATCSRYHFNHFTCLVQKVVKKALAYMYSVIVLSLPRTEDANTKPASDKPQTVSCVTFCVMEIQAHCALASFPGLFKKSEIRAWYLLFMFGPAWERG